MFLQEMGMPNPIPNELVLVFTGYLTYKGILYFPLVWLTAVAADCIGTSILYVVFYLFSSKLLAKKRRWLPISPATIEKLSRHITIEQKYKIYLFRLAPFVRGYTSVVTGMLRIRPVEFLPIALFSAITWSGIYLFLGNYFGDYWYLIEQNIRNIKFAFLIIGLCIIAFFTLKYLLFRSLASKEASNTLPNEQSNDKQ